MRTNILRHVAVALGLCVVSTQAYGGDYTAPAKWSNFNNQTTQTQSLYRTVGDKTNAAAHSIVQGTADAAHTAVQSTPIMQAPSTMTVPNCPPCATGSTFNGAVHGGTGYGAAVHGGTVHGGTVHGGTHGGVVHSGTHGGSIGNAVNGQWNQNNIISDQVISQTAPQTVHSTMLPAAPVQSAPMAYSHAPAVSHNSAGYSGYGSISQAVRRGGYGPIAPYYGGMNLLFLSLNDNNGNRNLITEDATAITRLSVGDLNPTDTVGFDLHFGRYLANGCHAFDFGYFHFDPGAVEQLVIPANPGDYRAAIQAFRTANVPIGNAYDLYNDAPEAVGYRGRRDLRFTGFEANLVSFGRMGARRIGASCNAGLGSGKGLGRRLGLNRAGCNYGGAGGGLSRGGNRVQVQTSHGIRYFRLEDEFELAGNINGVDGYQLDDIYYNIDVDNTLLGYQFGSQLSYCLTPRLLGTVGGKLGIYGNQVDYRHMLGTGNDLAYLTAAGVDDISTTESDTVLSCLAELNLGLGYRLSNAWTVTGGYRLISACGVATAPGSIATDFTSVVVGNDLQADDCLILHGGYVGLEYNW